jgi:hypothetical protein
MRSARPLSARPLRLALAAVAVAGVVLPAVHATAAPAGPGPFCKLYWPEDKRPSVTDNGNGTYTVDPGSRPQWVC